MPSRRLSRRLVTITACILCAASAAVAAGVPQTDDRGYQIAARSDHSDDGFSDTIAELRMVLRNGNGQEAERQLELRTLERENPETGDKTLIVFNSPRDLDGTALLSHARLIDPDDQWLFLPGLNRVKRISSVNKSGPFLGSEFAYEDFTAQEADKFSYRFLREEPCGDLTCDVVERTPLYEHSGYTRQVAWVDQSVYQYRRIDFYDRGGALIKTLTFEDYRLYEDRFWRAHLLRMENHVTGKSTDLIFSNYRFQTGLNDRDFVRGALARLR